MQTLSLDARITVQKPGAPNSKGECVVYWMQRAHSPVPMRGVMPGNPPGQGSFFLMCLRFAVGGGLTIGIAMLSRQYFEGSFLRLKDRRPTEKARG